MMLKKLTSPFYTTKKTRKIGLGLSLITLLSKQTNGHTRIRSKINKGTCVNMSFDHHHIDFPPIGNYGLLLADIVCGQTLLILDFYYTYKRKTYHWQFDNQNREIIINEINENIKRIEDTYEITD